MWQVQGYVLLSNAKQSHYLMEYVKFLQNKHQNLEVLQKRLNNLPE